MMCKSSSHRSIAQRISYTTVTPKFRLIRTALVPKSRYLNVFSPLSKIHFALPVLIVSLPPSPRSSRSRNENFKVNPTRALC